MSWKSNMEWIICNACAKLSALKNIQASITEKKVKAQHIGFGKAMPVLRHWWFIINSRPCIPPQKINVHPAPCHKPIISIDTKRFLILANSPCLFPPIGIYKYDFTQVPKVICQRRQKSIIDNAWYGELKFTGKRKLSINPKAIAISE